MGYAYIWRMGDTEFHRVGGTFDLKMRMRLSASDIPMDLTLLAFAQFDKLTPVMDELLAVLKPHHLRRDWYRSPSNLILPKFNEVVARFGGKLQTPNSIDDLPPRKVGRKAQPLSGEKCPAGHPLGIRDLVGHYCPTCAKTGTKYPGLVTAGQFAKRHYTTEEKGDARAD